MKTSCAMGHTLVNGSCDCDRVRAEAPGKMRTAITSPHLSHTRYRNWCGVGTVYAYHADPSSPSGVLLAESLDEPRYNKLLAELAAEGIRIRGGSPLSPTEGL